MQETNSNQTENQSKQSKPKKIGFAQKRRASREFVIQALYQHFMTGTAPDVVVAQFLEDNNFEAADFEFFSAAFKTICAKQSNYKEVFEKYFAKHSDQQGMVETAILLLAVYEFTERPEVPYKTVINEAVELCKGFGAQETFKFINGVLDRCAKQLRSEG